MTQNITSTITKGLVLGLIMIAISIGIYFAGFQQNGMQWISYAVYCIGIIICINQYGKQINYNSTFGNYFGHGFKVSATVTVIMIIYIVAFITLFPEFKEKAMDEARKAMDAKSNISEDQKTNALEMTRKFFMVFVVGGTLLYYLILGCIASLIGAAVTKKQPAAFHDDNQITG